jgi:hypothetical protein
MEFAERLSESVLSQRRLTTARAHHPPRILERGVFTDEVAETKVTQVMDFARNRQHRLPCVKENAVSNQSFLE